MTASTESFLNGRVTLHCGDCLDVLATLPECSVDSVVTDPPYHLTSIVKRFGGNGAAPAQYGKDGAYARASAGFMGKVWDGGSIAFDPKTWAEVLRVLKPGGYIVAFSSSRTYHRMAVAIEDAGFITHPLIAWVFGQGFPKAHNVSKHIDKMAGVKREVIGTHYRHGGGSAVSGSMSGPLGTESALPLTAPATDAAKQWDGWFYGTQSLKPAMEPIYVGQKPFEKGLNGTQNILKWGTGAINVGACRVGTENTQRPTGTAMFGKGAGWNDHNLQNIVGGSVAGRWPANIILDGSEEVVGAFPETGPGPGNMHSAKENGGGVFGGGRMGVENIYKDSGSAARFFYTAKADADDRLGSRHPTVKPVDLMQYLVRLVTPPGGVCLDPFAGTGTTGEAAWREGMRAILIEAEIEYQADVRRRMELVLAGPDEKAHAIVKAKGLTESPGPLFDGWQP